MSDFINIKEIMVNDMLYKSIVLMIKCYINHPNKVF